MEPAVDRYIDLGNDVRIPLAEIIVRVDPSRGPGGQHANRAATRVTACFDVVASPSLDDATRERLRAALGDVVRATSDATRSQHRNRTLALKALTERLRGAACPPAARRATRPSRATDQRRLDEKRRRSERKARRRPPVTDED